MQSKFENDNQLSKGFCFHYIFIAFPFQSGFESCFKKWDNELRSHIIACGKVDIIKKSQRKQAEACHWLMKRDELELERLLSENQETTLQWVHLTGLQVR